MKAIDLVKLIISIILLISPLYSQENDNEERVYLGFGQQTILVDPNINTNILAKRVLSTTKYKLTPGDTYELVIQLQQSERVPIILPGNYQLEIPYIGTIDVTDMYFDELRNTVISTIKSRLPVEYVDHAGGAGTAGIAQGEINRLHERKPPSGIGKEAETDIRDALQNMTVNLWSLS